MSGDSSPPELWYHKEILHDCHGVITSEMIVVYNTYFTYKLLNAEHYRIFEHTDLWHRSSHLEGFARC